MNRPAKKGDDVTRISDGRKGTILAVGSMLFTVKWVGANGRYDAPDAKWQQVIKTSVVRVSR